MWKHARLLLILMVDIRALHPGLQWTAVLPCFWTVVLADRNVGCCSGYWIGFCLRFTAMLLHQRQQNLLLFLLAA